MLNKKVIVAMSGGVDSSVAAAFLKEKGYEVIGMTAQFYTDTNGYSFPSEKDIKDAQRVAEKLEIPHYIINAEDEFKSKVIEYFVSEYRSGRTPNPCVVCNKEIKFGFLLEKAKQMGGEYLATGHYAVITHDNTTRKRLLKRGRESGKDQSYFLARLSQEKLQNIFFPVGSFSKAKIRNLAERFGLLVFNKNESQDVCFIRDGRISRFIENYSGLQSLEGSIVDEDDNFLGFHKGITGYTIGQRRGLGIAVGKPVFVNRIDAATNTVVVGDGESLYNSDFICTNAHWISVSKINKSIKVEVRIRFAHRPRPAELIPMKDGKMRIVFEKPQRAITPGQLAVFYNGEVVIGSAWIDKILN